ncbi:glycosyltransferase [Eubacteriaceae bacterium ES2]|nr:glycosyltransferase [Eubacteriaceae bacterium ES2]
MNATIIIPAYEPEENLQKIVSSVWNNGNRVVVVNDGSDRSKADLFQRLNRNAIVLHHGYNQGKGAAIKTALLYISGNIHDCNVIGVMDADGQHLPEDMEKLVAKVNKRADSLILGVRKIDQNMPIKSRLGNKITRLIFWILSGVKISDTQTGLRAFSRSMLNKLLAVEGTRYEYETNVLFFCVKKEIPILEVPIETIYHDETNSCSHFHVLRDSFRIYKDILKFLLTSLSSFFLDFIMFCILTLLFPVGAIGVTLANVFARIISGTYNYFMNCRFVFHLGAKPQSAFQYLSLAVLILLFNSLLLQFYNGFSFITVFEAKIFTEISFFFVSFIIQRKLIFRKN